MGTHFSDIHTSKESQLYGTPVTVEDNQTITELRKAVEDYPNDYNLRIKLGEALSYQLRYREAIEIYTDAVAIDPNNIIGYRRRGGRYLTTFQLNKAYDDFKICSEYGIKLDTEYMLGLVTYMIGKYDEAKLHYDNCLKLAKNCNDTEMLIGVIYWYAIVCIRCGNLEAAKKAFEFYSPEMNVGHHTAYKCGVELFIGKITSDEAFSLAQNAEGESSDLEYSMIIYALANYKLSLGDKSGYEHLLDMVLERDYYWAGFASLAAMNDRHSEIAEKAVPEKLLEYFKEHTKMAIAFSGGVDSSYLLYAAKSCGADVVAYYVKTQFQPEFELDDAKKISSELKVKMSILNYDILSCPEVKTNRSDRCYFCKRKIFEYIMAEALSDGYTLILDGTNADDDASDRPGMKALSELEVKSPLKLFGINKAEIRKLSREAGLFTWNKPAYACLATRILLGEEITAEKLERTDSAEKILKNMGFTDLRVRDFYNQAKIQIPEAQFDKALHMRDEIYNSLKKYYSEVVLDLKSR